MNFFALIPQNLLLQFKIHLKLDYLKVLIQM